MKTRALLSFGIATLLAFTSLHGAAALPRLFPDIAPGFHVGDPEARNPIASTEGPKTLAAGDLNGDGIDDVIAGNLDGSISILVGRTNNTFLDQILVPATGLLSNSSLRSVVRGDFNGDGKLDIVVGDIARAGVVVLLGGGNGTLLPFSRTPVGPVRAMAVADFNHDNKLDLLVACSPPDCEWCFGANAIQDTNRFLCILRGNGDGTFGAPQYLLTPGTSACFYDVDASDLNGDGHPDATALDSGICFPTGTLVVRSRRIQIFANDGNGGFATNAPSRVLESAGEGPRAFQVTYID
ncbi:MAG TPA: VCBS repeat-containing protein, partial [Verrucomicrobiae bacterium]